MLEIVLTKCQLACMSPQTRALVKVPRVRSLLLMFNHNLVQWGCVCPLGKCGVTAYRSAGEFDYEGSFMRKAGRLGCPYAQQSALQSGQDCCTTPANSQATCGPQSRVRAEDVASAEGRKIVVIYTRYVRSLLSTLAAADRE